MQKIQKEIKRQMERELRQYYDNKKLIKKLQNDMKTSTRSLMYLEQRILYVENVISRLNAFERQVFDMIFKEKADCIYCQTHFSISKSTYYNVINKSIDILAQEWGIV